MPPTQSPVRKPSRWDARARRIAIAPEPTRWDLAQQASEDAADHAVDPAAQQYPADHVTDRAAAKNAEIGVIADHRNDHETGRQHADQDQAFPTQHGAAAQFLDRENHARQRGIESGRSPPAAPAAINSLLWKDRKGRRRFFQKRPHASMRAAPTCTDGPSRPMEAPASSPMNVRGIFQTVCGSDTRLYWLGPGGKDSAPITCGIPLPDALGARRKVSQRAAARPKGSRIKASQLERAIQEAFHFSARSANRAKPSETSEIQRGAAEQQRQFHGFSEKPGRLVRLTAQDAAKTRGPASQGRRRRFGHRRRTLGRARP